MDLPNTFSKAFYLSRMDLPNTFSKVFYRSRMDLPKTLWKAFHAAFTLPKKSRKYLEYSLPLYETTVCALNDQDASKIVSRQDAMQAPKCQTFPKWPPNGNLD